MNVERGQLLLKSKVIQADYEGNAARNLAVLFQYFEPCVGVMAINGVFAAGRIAQACLEIAKRDDAPDIDFLSTEVLKHYIESGGNNAQTKTTTRSSTPGVLQRTREATEEEVALDPTLQEKNIVFQELAGNTPIDGLGDGVHIDVNEDIPVSYLNIEGLRARGLIKVDFDEENDELPVIEDDMIRVKVYGNHWDRADAIVLCPQCQGINLFSDYEDRYECMDCATTFMIEYEEEEEEEAPSVILKAEPPKPFIFGAQADTSPVRILRPGED